MIAITSQSDENFKAFERSFLTGEPQYFTITNPKSLREGAVFKVRQRPGQPEVSLMVEGYFDKRKSKFDFFIPKGFWLPDYQGPTIYVQKPKPKRKTISAYDRLGREISVGDFCSYVLFHHGGEPACVCFGNVDRITHGGKVWMTNTPLKKNDRVETKEVKYNTTIVILENLMDELVMARLKV